MRCHYQGLMKVFVFLCIGLHVMGNRLVSRLYFFSTFSVILPSYPFFYFFLPLTIPLIFTSGASFFPLPSPCQHCHSMGSPECITDLSPLVLFMVLSLFKFNQASIEPPEPFQFTTWMQQDGKSYANIKV